MGSLRRQLATAVMLAIGALLLGATSASAGTFSSATPITIGSGQCSTLQQPAVPYPSTLEAEQTGTITDVNVTLTNFSHTYPEDVRVLLVGPQGQTVLLVHEAGEAEAADDVTFTLDDEAATTIPVPLVAGTYRPTQTGRRVFGVRRVALASRSGSRRPVRHDARRLRRYESRRVLEPVCRGHGQ